MGVFAEWWRGTGMAIWEKAVYAIIILLVGYVVSKIVSKVVARGLGRTRIADNRLLIRFLSRTAALIIIALALVMALDKIKVDVKAIIAGLGVTGFIAGFALRDTLSNFAAGLMVVAYRPFKVKDMVKAGGETGRVEEINAVSTILRTDDNKQVTIPNSRVWGISITNFDAYRPDPKEARAQG